MSTDAVKAAIVLAFPDTREADWKRRSRTKVPAGVSRTFEHADGRTIETVEKPNGVVEVVADKLFVSKGTGIGPTITVEEGQAALDAITVPAPAAVPKASKATGTVTRNQLVVGSVWRVIRDTQIVRWVKNPALREIERLYPKGGWGNDPRWDALPKQVRVNDICLTEGMRFTVLEAPKNAYRSYCDTETDGLLLRVDIANGPNVKLPMTQIAKSVVAESVPESLVYVMRDTATGKFFGGWEVEKMAKTSYVSYRQTDVPRMVDRFSSAKKYKTAAAVLASIRDFTGYAKGLSDDDHGYRGEWVANTDADKKMDLPETWEGVVVDKTTGVEKETFDIQTKHRESLRLRGITAGHGSAVRAVYKKAEGKGFDAILVFQNRARGSYQIGGEVRHYDDAEPWEELSDEGAAIFAAVDEALAAMSGKKMRVKTGAAIAVACSSLDGFAAVLAFDRDLSVDVKLLDWDNLKELTLPEPADA